MIQTKDLGYNNRFWQSGLAFCFAVIVLMLVIGSGVSATTTQVSPPSYTDQYIKATTCASGGLYANWSSMLVPRTGGLTGWVGTTGSQQRLNVDMGSAYNVSVMHLGSWQNGAGDSIKTFYVYGSNSSSSFNDVNYADDTGWTQVLGLTTVSSYDQNYTFSNPGTYEYYSLKAATDNGGGNLGIGGGDNLFLAFYESITPPVASFTANVTTGTAPFTVQFTDTSTNSPTSWSWKDNGVQVATVQSPGLLFPTGDIGNNNITLTATNSYGSNTSAITDIQAYVPVTSVATTLSGSLTVGSTLSASNLQPAGASVNYQWVWCATSNGAYQSIPSATGPSYTITSTYQGDYIELLASGTNFYSGSVYSATLGPVGMAPVPVASFTANVTSGTAPFAVNLTDTSTNSPTSWSWENNGVLFDTVQQSPSILFLTGDIGNNNITLTATNSFGSNTSAITDIQVYVPVTSVATTLSGSLIVGSTLSASNLQPAGASVNYQWVWCATSNGAYQSIPSATGPSYTITSTYQGDYIELLASGTNFYSGSVYSATLGPVGMAPVTPVASFTANVTSGNAPLAVQLTDTSTNSPTSWSWESNGLPFSSLENPSEVFSGGGTYNITLLATNGAGTGTSGITQIVVAPPAVTGVGIGADVASGTANAPVAVNFTAYYNTTNTAFINAPLGSTAWVLVSAPYGQRNISIGSYDILNPTFLAAGTYDLMATFTTDGTVGTQNETATLNYVVEGSAPQIQWTQNDYVTTVQTLTTGQTVYFSGNTAPLGRAATPFAVNVQIDRIDPVTGTAYAVLWPECNFTSLSTGYIDSFATVSPTSSLSPGRWLDLLGDDYSIQGSAVMNTPGTYVIYLTFEDANGGLPVDDGLQNQLIVSQPLVVGGNPITLESGGNWAQANLGAGWCFVIALSVCVGCMTALYMITKRHDTMILILGAIAGMVLSAITGLISVWWILLIAVLGVIFWLVAGRIEHGGQGDGE